MRVVLKDSFMIANIKSELKQISSLILFHTDISVYGVVSVAG